MKLLLSLLFCTMGIAYGQQYKKVHSKAIMVDSHNDILTAAIEKNVQIDDNLIGKTHSDLSRFKTAGIDVQLFSVWCDGDKKEPLAWANREMDTLDAVIARNPNKITLVKNHSELTSAINENKLAAMFGVEGGHMIENKLENLDHFYNRGARYMTLTWNNSTTWASSAWDETAAAKKSPADKGFTPGLNDFGKQVIKRMNQLGMLIDLSHVGEQTFKDAIALTTKPVLVSHSNTYTLCPVPRNLKDDQIDAIGKNGGVIQLNFYSGFVDSAFKNRETQFMLSHAKEIDSLMKGGVQKEYAMSMIAAKYEAESNALRPPLSALLDHLDYIVNRIGVDHVGMGSDFDGVTSTPLQLDDITSYPLITKALLEKGYSKKQVYKIMGGNFLRVLKANE